MFVYWQFTLDIDSPNLFSPSHLIFSSSANLLMELGAVISCLLALLAIPLTSLPSYLLFSHLSTILPLKRNIFTHLDTLFIWIGFIRVIFLGSQHIALLVLHTLTFFFFNIFFVCVNYAIFYSFTDSDNF